MFVLRIIEETRESENKPFEQVINNYEVGKAYTVIKNGISKEFDAIMESYEGINKDDISAVLCVEKRYDENNVFFIMHPKVNQVFSYFIMTESGKTFERL
jgi:hypothetical protein